MTKRGLFIVFEGIDTSGKNFQLHNLEKKIEELNKWQDVLRTHEPWESDEIKHILQTETDSYSQSEKMARILIEDRTSHTHELIRPALKARTIVLSSRYTLSLAYQWAQGFSLSELMKMHEHRGILIPDITFFLDISPETAVQRRGLRTASLEKFEYNLLFVDKLVHAYRALVHMSNVDQSLFGKVVTIDANRSLEDVSNDIYAEFVKVYQAAS